MSKIFVLESFMKLNQIQAKAKDMGLDFASMKKDDLIRSIQAKEGNEACYKSGRFSCDQYGCCWREDCKPK